MRIRKAMKSFGVQYCEFLNLIAKKHSVTVEHAQKELTEFVHKNYVFIGRGNIWKTFDKLPKPYEYFLHTKIIEPDFISSLELVSFLENVPISNMLSEIESCIAEAYKNKDNEIWKTFDKQPTAEQFGAALIDILAKYDDSIF